MLGRAKRVRASLRTDSETEEAVLATLAGAAGAWSLPAPPRPKCCSALVAVVRRWRKDRGVRASCSAIACRLDGWLEERNLFDVSWFG